MREIDRATIEGFGLSSLVLMERAALSVVGRIATELEGRRRALVIAGPGNNGGDGLAIARELHNRGYAVKVLLTGRKDKLSPDCAAQLETARKYGVPVTLGTALKPADTHGAFIVDALFGTGLGKDITGPLAALVKEVNQSGAPVVSVDIPSGVCSDTGRVLGVAVEAEMTVTFGLPKRGHYLHPGAELTGKLFVEDIGFPRALYDVLQCSLVTEDSASALLPARPRYSHKGDYGHVLVVAGSSGKTGAAFLCAEAALSGGAGLVTMAAPEALEDIYMSRATEAMTLPLPCTEKGGFSSRALEGILEFLDEHQATLALGPGLGKEADTVALVHGLMKRVSSPMVLDADALNAIGKRLELFESARAPIIITPHPGEFSRLTGRKVAEVEADRVGEAQRYAAKSGAHVLLKGAPTVTAAPEGETYINTSGGPALAKGGSGDVLTGLCTSFMAQGLWPLEAARLAAYMHGAAGDFASEDLTGHCVSASDLISYMPEVFNRLVGRGI